MAACSVCSCPLLSGKMTCLKCGAITVSDSPGGTVREEDFMDVMDVEAMAVPRIVTGEWWDEAFNGGFVPTCSTLLGGSPGAGKGLELRTPLPLFSGGFVEMGEVAPGAELIDADGVRTRVLACSDVHRLPCFDVTFSDGAVLTADIDHQWLVSDSRRRESVVTTPELMPRSTTVAARVPDWQSSREKWRHVVSVREVPSVPTRCVSVDSPSRTYLAGRGMIPTHNTTWLIQVGVVVAKITGRPTYLISAEQDKGELKMTIDRLQLPLERGMLRVLKKMGAGGSIDEEIFKQFPPGMLILDSVTALCGKDKEAQVAVGRLYKQYSIKYKAPSFLISHMTKEGDMAGMLTMQHDCDCIASFFACDNERSRYHGMPALELHKYRFGPTHKEWQLIMTPLGLVRAPAEKLKKSDDVEEVIMQATAKAQEKIIAKAMEAETARRRGTVAVPAALDGSPSASAVSATAALVISKTTSRKLALVRPPLPRAVAEEEPSAAERAAAFRATKKKDIEGKTRTTSVEIRERRGRKSTRAAAPVTSDSLEEPLLRAIAEGEVGVKKRKSSRRAAVLPEPAAVERRVEQRVAEQPCAVERRAVERRAPKKRVAAKKPAVKASIKKNKKTSKKRPAR